MLKHYWKLFRGYNLLIIVCTMLILHIFNMHASGCYPDGILLPLTMLMFSIVFIAAGGNCINDCMDIVSDQFNHKSLHISPQAIPVARAGKCYIVSTVIGLLTAIVPAYYLHSYLFYIIFPLSAVCLYLYSKYLKRKPLIGNITIALLTAMVIVTQFLFYHIACSVYLPSAHSCPNVMPDTRIWLGTAVLAFWLTLIRELIKTMEDVEGDSVAAYHTIAVTKGIEFTKITTNILTIFLEMIFVLIPFSLLTNNILIHTLSKIILFVYFVLCVSIPTIVLSHNIRRIHTSADCHKASRLTKIIMLNGIFTFLVITLLLITIG